MIPNPTYSREGIEHTSITHSSKLNGAINYYIIGKRSNARAKFQSDGVDGAMTTEIILWWTAKILLFQRVHKSYLLLYTHMLREGKEV